MELSFLRFYIDEPSDESYTPATISIRIGTNEQNLTEVLKSNISNMLSKYTDEGSWVYCSLEDVNFDSLCSIEDVENNGPKIGNLPYVDDPTLLDQDEVRSKNSSDSPLTEKSNPEDRRSPFEIKPRTSHTDEQSIVSSSDPHLSSVDHTCSYSPNYQKKFKKQYHTGYFVQFAILNNHQNGRDTHIRQIQIFSPRYFLDKKFKIKCDREKVLKRWVKGEFYENEIDVKSDLDRLEIEMAESSTSKSISKRSHPYNFGDRCIDTFFGQTVDGLEPVIDTNIDRILADTSHTDPSTVSVEDYYSSTEKFNTLDMAQFSVIR